MRILFELAVFFGGGALGFMFGWWRCRRAMQGTIDKIAAQLKLNQAKLLEYINANIRLRKNVR